MEKKSEKKKKQKKLNRSKSAGTCTTSSVQTSKHRRNASEGLNCVSLSGVETSICRKPLGLIQPQNYIPFEAGMKHLSLDPKVVSKELHSITSDKCNLIDVKESNDLDDVGIPESLVGSYSCSEQHSLSNYVLSTSEQEPSLFQVELPDKHDVLAYAKICAVMNDYPVLDETFDFSSLQGISRESLERTFCGARSCSDLPIVGGGSHRPIDTSLLDCFDDLVVKGFFREKHEEFIVEATLFSSEKHRQFIVSYRGKDELQAKPVKRSAKQKESGGGISYLHQKHKYPVNPCFRNAYFVNILEERIFALLNKLSDITPFCDVVMTGHSFGAALATIGAFRYACLRPMMRVSCHAFSCPRVGGLEFRQALHSLPNLKIIRLECGADPYVFMPEGKDWCHVGHTITIGKEGAVYNTSIKVKARAYQFDTHRPSRSIMKVGKPGIASCGNGIKGKQGGKVDHRITSYVQELEVLARSTDSWVSTFEGEEGEGIGGCSDEMRYVV